MKNQRINQIHNTRLWGILFLSVVAIWASGCGSDGPAAPEETSTGELSGQVALIEGEAMTVRVLADGKLIAAVQTDAAGNYRVENLPPGNYTVEVTAKGYQSQETTIQVVANQVTSLDKISLKPLGVPVAHIRGVLSNQATKGALQNVTVLLIDGDVIHETLTTKTGAFSFDNLPVDQKFTLKVAHDGYEAEEVTINPIPEGETAKFEIALVPIVEEEELPVGDGLSIGIEAPPFSHPDGNGKNYSLADYAGKKKVVLVFYRGTW